MKHMSMLGRYVLNTDKNRTLAVVYLEESALVTSRAFPAVENISLTHLLLMGRRSFNYEKINVRKC